MLPCHDLRDLGVELLDINDLAGVLLLDVGGDGEVIVLLGNFVVGDEGGEVRLVGAVQIRGQNRLDVILRELVAVGDLDALPGRVQKQRMVISLGLFQHHDAGRNRRAVEQVVRKLDDAVDEVVVDQVFADLLFRAAAIHDAGEADDGRRAVGRQPRKAVHDERKVGLRFRGQHTGRRKARVVDERGVVAALPADGVGRIGYDGLKRLVVPVLGTDQRIAVGDVKFVVVNVVQEHIDAAEVVGRDIDLLPVKALPDVAGAENFCSLQKQGTGTAGGIIDLVDLGLSGDGNARQKFGHLLRRKIFAAALARIGGVHAHEIFIGIAKGVDGIVAVITELHIAHAVHQLDQPLVALGDRAAQLVAVDVDVVK